MATPANRTFDDVVLDHVGFYVSDLAETGRWWTDSFGFSVYAKGDATVALGSNQIHLVLTEPGEDHPGNAYLAKHGDGVFDIALRTADATAAYEEAVARGATSIAPPTRDGDLITATVQGFGDVNHTFVQRAAAAADDALPGLRPVPVGTGPSTYSLGEVDHFAVCVEAGTLDATVEFYQRVLDFELIFVERVEVGTQAMTTKVVQSQSGSVTFTLIEPDVSRDPGHIDGFLKDHDGAGVQHIAFTTDNVVAAVEAVQNNGVEFLGAPDMYYRLLPERVELVRYTVDELKQFSVLVDEDHDGQLYQIFAKSVHPRNTIFMELIERLGARTFGSGNIASLYEAVELERQRGGPEAAGESAAA
ncbi:4-hydroxymandelate synthase [Actinokineospora alba]|uniref:4-hydroxymandelate synthase n=1 Tax=Actinokineospora alba TaxID=504798 RepID=A0A1H0HD50_9PSEU|nr:4-hydroxyphenylpyruvate dioxygenase [Actinokineospora alba]TDP64942.1 4-hydroxymandelate synthase [Actinokineospora alba]SDH49912.1 4-hydroxymandelate synthase [Actinokineospora alba]SDO16791.1 4-hydroxymandelate synthase [Actinokineospora alba]